KVGSITASRSSHRSIALAFRENATTPVKKKVERSHVTDHEIVVAASPAAGFGLVDQRIRRTVVDGYRTEGSKETARRGWLAMDIAGHAPNLGPLEGAKKPWAAIGPTDLLHRVRPVLRAVY